MAADEEADKRADEAEKRAEAKEAEKRERMLHPSLMSLTPDEMCGGKCFSDDEIYADVKAADKRMAERDARDRAAVAKGSFDKRLIDVRFRLTSRSDDWGNRNLAASKLTAEQVWDEGYANGDFAEGEKKAVYEAQGEHLKEIREYWDDKHAREKAKAESDQYQAWVAQGEQLRSPAMFIQPFAFAAMGLLIGAAYAGSQTGLLVGETYNASKGGLSADCGAMVAQDAVAVTLHYATRGKPEAEGPRARRVRSRRRAARRPARRWTRTSSSPVSRRPIRPPVGSA
jgi:hypothetical protein